MPVRNRRPDDDRPLFRAVNDQRLIRAVGTGSESQEGTAGSEEPRAASGATETPQAEKGPIARAFDTAEQNNWVYPSMANAARERGLLEKADSVFSRVRAQLGG